MASPQLPQGGDFVWIVPAIRGGLDSFDVVDASGVVGAGSEMTCGSRNLYYAPGNGLFGTAECGYARPVACCERVAPAMIPAMSAVGPGGRALIVALMILALGAYGLRRESARSRGVLGA